MEANLEGMKNSAVDVERWRLIGSELFSSADERFAIDCYNMLRGYFITGSLFTFW